MNSGTKNSWVEFDTDFKITKVMSKDNRLRMLGYHFHDVLPDQTIEFLKGDSSFLGYKFEGMQVEIIRPQTTQLGFSICISDNIEFIESKLNSISCINEKLMHCHNHSELIKQAVSICKNDLEIDRAGFFFLEHETQTMQGTWGTNENGEIYEESDFSVSFKDKDFLIEMIENHETIKIRKNIPLETSGKVNGKGWHIAIVLWTTDGAIGWLSCDNFINHKPLYSMQNKLMDIFCKSLSQWFNVLENNQKMQKISSDMRKVVEEKSKNLQSNMVELTSMHKKVHSFERINMLSKFTSGLAHEINNPNSFVMANISYLQKQKPVIESIEDSVIQEEYKRSFKNLKEDWSEILDDSHEGLNRIKRIIAALEPINYCMSEEYSDIYIISELNIISEKYNDSLVCNLNIPRDSLFRINSKKVVIDTVLNNIFKNSFEAYKKSNSAIEDSIVDVNIKDVDGNVTISIRDYATGVNKEDINKIFDPFSTDKDEHKSVGLGLSVAQQLLLSVDGNIYANICSVGLEIIIDLPKSAL